jgi:hypothetical protein
MACTRRLWPDAMLNRLVVSVLAIAFSVGFLIALPGPVGATDSATLRSIPATQALAAARDSMSKEEFATFRFPKLPCMGIYTHEIFIPTKYVALSSDVKSTIADTFEKLALGVRVVGHGDNRTQSRTFDPARTRAYLVLDFDAGKGWLVANHSAAEFLSVNSHELHTVTFHARKVHVGWNVNDNSRIAAEWVTPDVFRVRYSLQSAGPGTSVLLPSIDHQLLINRLTGAVTLEGDKYPSTGTYAYPEKIKGSTQTVRQVSGQNGLHLNDLGGKPAFSYPQHSVNAKPGHGCPFTTSGAKGSSTTTQPTSGAAVGSAAVLLAQLVQAGYCVGPNDNVSREELPYQGGIAWNSGGDYGVCYSRRDVMGQYGDVTRQGNLFVGVAPNEVNGQLALAAHFRPRCNEIDLSAGDGTLNMTALFNHTLVIAGANFYVQLTDGLWAFEPDDISMMTRAAATVGGDLMEPSTVCS